MAERNFTDGDIKALGKEIASAIGKGGGSAPQAKVKELIPKETFDVFDTAMKGTGAVVNATKDAYNTVAPAIQGSLETWRDLSKVGAGFSNDVVGMTAAAAGTRMPLGDFASVIKNNTENLSGFGGNITRGGEEFARLSRKMFDDYAPNTDQLRQMGITNKDLNELLMIQSVSTRAKMKDGDDKDKKLIENAMALGTEMDLMAKLTGKSREAQMEQQRKNQQDMAFEAAIRLKTIGMDADKALEFETNARNQLRDAQLRGTEAVFKDVFTTGNIVSKEAGLQASINQEQAAATMKQATVSADKTLNAAERERQANAAAAEGRRAFDKDMQNGTKLFYASIGETGGTVGKVMRDSMSANIEYQRNLEATATKMGIVIKTDEDRAKVQKQMDEDAKAAAAGRKADGTQADASTKALVNLGARAGDVESAFMNKIVAPLNQKVNPAFDKLAENVLGATERGRSETRVNTVQRELDEGARGKQTTATNKIGALNEEVGNSANSAAGVKNPPQPRSGGTYGAGKMFEDVGSILEITKPGEVVLNGEQQMNLAKGMMDKGAATAFTNLSKNLDFNKISQDIKTTISGGGATTIKVPDMNEMTKPFNKSFDEFGANFDDVVAKMSTDIQDAMPVDNEFGDLAGAIAKQQSDNMGEFAGVDDAVASQSAMNDAVAASSPTATQSRGITMDSFTLGSNGLPIAKPKSTAAAVPEKKAEGKTATEQAEEKEAQAKADIAKGEKGEKSKEPLLDSKNATLDDVVKSLNSLNMQMGQLIEINESGHKSTAKAARSVSGNIYNK